jgi:hypothetical protein
MIHRNCLPLILCTAVALGMTVGCSAAGKVDPVQRMVDTTRDAGERAKAVEQARTERYDDPARIANLHRLVWDRGHPDRLRRLAIDQLIEYNEADFKAALTRRIVLIQNWDTMQYILDTAVKRNWTDMTATLVRQYARPAKAYPDSERPERDALAKLNPGRTVEQVVFDVFADANDQVETAQQVGAWELLCRTTPPARLVELLASAPDSTPLVIDLKATARDLGTVPMNREGVLWMSHLRDPKQQAFWAAARDAVARLTPEQRVDLQLRHLPMLVAIDPDLLTLGRAALLARTQAGLANVEHHTKAPTYDGQAVDYPQMLYESADKLCWADLASLLTLQRVVAQPKVAAALFEQADADQRDPGSEHGGLIRNESAGQVARAYPPAMRHHDRKFLASEEMIRDMYTSLAHYHFHAQEFKNSAYAGPGIGDLKLADRLNCTGLVFTFINASTLNVDYYQPNGAVIDLGVIRR